MMRSLKNWLKSIPKPMAGAGFLTAAMLVLSFPPYSVVALAYIGMVPFFLALFRARSWKDAAWVGGVCMSFFILLGFQWVSFVVSNFGGLPWIAGKAVLVLFSFFAELQFLILALMTYAILKQKRVSALLFWVGLPLAYAGLDYLYPKIFPTTLGQAMYAWLPLAQVAEYTGVFGLTPPIVACNLALAVLIECAVLKRPTRLPSPKGAVVVLALVAVGLSLADRWGRGRIVELNAQEQKYSRHFKFSIMQGNIGDMEKLASEQGFSPAVDQVLGTYSQMSFEAIKRDHPNLIIWPETSYPFLYTHMQDESANRSGMARDRWVAEYMARAKTPLFFGGYSALNGKDFNTAFLVLPPYKFGGQYRKSILLAFGEYVPLGPLSPIVERLIPQIANFGRGKGPMVMDVEGVKVGPQICYEGIFPEHSRESIKLGADVLLNITNDSWFGGGTEPTLHLLLTAFRAIELRRPLIRATNTGISTLIDISGEMRYSTRLFEKTTLTAELKLPATGQEAPVTFFYKHGDVFGEVCAAIAIALMAYLFAPILWQRSRRKK